jgi:hypothetical protein
VNTNRKLDILTRCSEHHSKRGSISEENDNQLITTVFKPEHVGTYDPEHGRLVVISSAWLQEIPEIRFNSSFLDKVIAARSNNQEYLEEIIRMVVGNSNPP